MLTYTNWKKEVFKCVILWKIKKLKLGSNRFKCLKKKKKIKLKKKKKNKYRKKK